ncbi:MAG: hypothetical protein ACREQN_12465, partial [Candidatus Binataceae bacterium]
AALKWPREARRARKSVLRFSRMALHPRRMRLFVRVGGWLAKPFARDGYLRRMPPPFNAWTKARDFPAPRARRHGPAPKRREAPQS